MSKKVVKVGTRDSILAMWQTQFVVDELKKVTDQYEFEIISLKTKGDKILDVALAKIGDKGLFTKELEVGLLEGEIDFAVHSMKDMPTALPEGLQISSMLKRHNPADAFVSDKYKFIMLGTTNTGSCVCGCSSVVSWFKLPSLSFGFIVNIKTSATEIIAQIIEQIISICFLFTIN